MNKNLIAMLCIALIVTMPIAYSIDVEDLDERDTGESIVINVDDYEPKVVPANVLEENNVPVYAFLKGYTLGTLLGEDEPMPEPFYGSPKIKKITSVKKVEHNPYIIGGVRFIPPSNRQYSLDNLGTAVITLKKIEEEHEVPNNITVNVTARIYFDAERIRGMGRQELVLTQDSDEDAWKQKDDLTSYSFWSGRGYIRASKIKENEAKFEIYDGSLRTLKSLTLKKGSKPSSTIKLRYASDLMDDRFRVQIVDIIDPSEERAKVEVNVNGEISERQLKVGESLYSGSKWKLDYIAKTSKDGEEIEKIILEDSSGNIKTIEKTIIKVDGEEIEGEDPCETATPIEDIEEWQKDKQISDTLTREDKKDLYCTAISEFKKVIRDYPDSKDENGILWKDRAYYYVGLSYEKLINVLTLEEKAYRNKAVEEAISAFESSIANSKGEFIADARSRLFELKERNIKDISYGIKTFEEDDNYVQVKFLGIKPEDETKQSQANIRVYDKIKEGLIVGDSIDVGDWFISEISENKVNIKKGPFKIKYPVKIDEEKETGFIGVEETGEKYKWILTYDNSKIYINKTTDSTEKINLETHDVPQYKSHSDNKLYSIKLVEEDTKKKGDTATVTIKRTLISSEEGKETKEETKVLRLNKNIEVDGKDIKLLRVDLHKEAHVVIIPGSGKEVYSDSSFMIHIPIEKRAIKLSPEKIDEQINKTEKQIEKLDKIITRLDSVIRSWKALCLITFATFTIKNSFFGGMARSQARQKVMQGTTENPGWRRYCEDNGGYNKLYSSYDDCMLQNNDQIIGDIDKAQKAVEYSTKQKYTDDETSIGDLNIEDIRKFEKADYGEKIISKEEARDLVFFQKLSESCSGYSEKEDKNGNILPDYCRTATIKYESLLDAYQKKEEMYGRVNGKMGEWTNEYYSNWEKSHPGMTLAQYKADRNANLAAYTKAEQKRVSLSSMGIDFTEKESQKKSTAIPGVVRQEGFKKYVYDSNNIKYEVEEIELKEGEKVEKKIYKIKDDDTNKEILKNIAGEGKIYVYDSGGLSSNMIKVDTIRYEEETGKAWINGMPVNLKKNEKDKFVIDDTRYPGLNNQEVTTDKEYYLTEGYRTTYAPKATAEFYEDNKPYCVPTKNGDFVKVKEYDKRGNPSVFEVWNVGPDGLICTADDVPKLHKSLISRPEHQKEYNNAERTLNQVLRMKVGDVINIGEKSFRISRNKALAEAAKGAPKCQDVMDPTDCAILFGICDPVMCPPSRCNFGGRWYVDNVVKTGIIGSVVLCAPNFNLPYEPVPVCLTGILAGLQNIRSILQGYVQCLKTAKVHDKSVGICDKIRSVFICEILWQEAIAIWNIQGGIMSWLSDFFFGKSEGGGEYLNFQSSMQNVVDSVKFFTADYAKTAFAAYNSRSLDEIGTEICKSAIFGKVPGMGDFFDQLTAPESPPQFTAVLSEMPWSESQKQSRYNVYYHIYAGEVEDARYSVFIKNDFGRMVFATEGHNRKRSTIEKGDYADFSVDFVADSGYNEVCVEINGITKCGFGKVSSEFALNYLDNMLVKDETERNIESEEDCVPDNPRTSPSLASLVMPGQPGLLSTGIVRVCSIQNPGQGTNPEDWKPVGSCGKDNEGHNLGSCWMDMRTVSIKDLKMKEELAKELDEKGLEYEKEQRQPYTEETLLEPEESREELYKIEGDYEIKEKTWKNIVSIIASYKHLALRSLDPKVSLKAQFNIAKLYILLAETIPEEQEIDDITNTFILVDATPEQKLKAAKKLKSLIEAGNAKAIEFKEDNPGYLDEKTEEWKKEIELNVGDKVSAAELSFGEDAKITKIIKQEDEIYDYIQAEGIISGDIYERVKGVWKEWKSTETEETLTTKEETKTTPLLCKLISAKWSKKEAVENEEVELIVNGENCDEEDRVIFRVYEEDAAGNDKATENPKPATFDETGKATSTWIAEYQEDGWGIWRSDPEYRFTAEKGDEIRHSGLLTVKKK